MNIKSYMPYFSKEMSKTSGMAMPLMMGGLTLASMAGAAASNSQTAKLSPPQTGINGYQLGTSNDYQFEGGKHLPTKPVTSLNNAFIGTAY